MRLFSHLWLVWYASKYIYTCQACFGIWTSFSSKGCNNKILVATFHGNSSAHRPLVTQASCISFCPSADSISFSKWVDRTYWVELLKCVLPQWQSTPRKRVFKSSVVHPFISGFHTPPTNIRREEVITTIILQLIVALDSWCHLDNSASRRNTWQLITHHKKRDEHLKVRRLSHFGRKIRLAAFPSALGLHKTFVIKKLLKNFLKWFLQMYQ